jgi:DNA-binding winged helix-turn-helix (wHTH) protein/Tfp pilus assembly protein PilF
MFEFSARCPVQILNEPSIYHFAGFRLDAGTRTLRCGRKSVELPPKAVETLLVLVRRADHVVPKHELMDALWPDGFVEEGNLTQYIYMLRRAFKQFGIDDAIETLARRGYRFRLGVAVTQRRHFDWPRAVTALAACAMLAIAASSARPVSAIDAQTRQLYALGRYYWDLRSVAGMERSIGYFRAVIARAPDRALGYAGLADAYTELADFASPCGRCAGWERAAKRAAAKALALEPAAADAHVSMGMVARVFAGDDRTAAREFRLALAIDPNEALAHQWLGNMLVAHGDFESGRQQLEVAAAQQPVATAIYAWLARANYYEQRYADAHRYAQEALALQPDRLETNVLLGLIDEAQGRYDAALRQFDAVGRLGAATDAAVLRASVIAAMGKRASALAMLRKIASAARRNAYAWRDMVRGYVNAHDIRAAKAQLARVRFATVLDRELFADDPQLRSLGLNGGVSGGGGSV